MNKYFHLRNHLLLAALAAAYPVIGHAAGAATVDFAAGNVVAITPAGVQRALAKGSVVESGELIRTADNGRAQLRFSDGGFMSLQPTTDFKIESYRYNGKNDGEEKGIFSLIKGGLRTITGLVGKGKRDAYQLNTSVATIGIRGTEYSVAFTGGTDGKMTLATGEGAVEVCNSGGCVTVAGGQAAVVTGSNSQPKMTDSKPLLSPASTTPTSSQPLFSSTDAPAGLESGPGYAVLGAGVQNGSPTYKYTYPGETATATFGPGSQLQSIDVNGENYSGTASSSFAINNVLGWGTWVSGTATNSGSTDTLTNFHYVVGKPTSTADLMAMGTQTINYSLIGYTNPTSTTGLTGTVDKANSSLQLNFSGGEYSANATIAFSIGGTGFGINGNTSSQSTAITSFGGSCTTGCSGGSVSLVLLLAGANAQNAGMVYKVYTGVSGIDTVTGAAAFGKTP